MSFDSASPSRDPRQHYELRQEAAEFYRSLRLPERLELALNSALRRAPGDVYGYLAEDLARLAKTPTICAIDGRNVLDGSGNPALEVGVCCTVKNVDKKISAAGISEAVPENEKRKSVDTALEWIKHDIGPLIKGISPDEQSKIDHLLREYFKPKRKEAESEMQGKEAAPLETPSPSSPRVSPKSSKKRASSKGRKMAAGEMPIPPPDPPEQAVCGGLAIGAVSLAVARSSAVLRESPLYLHVAALKNEQLMPTTFTVPIPMISVLSCGKSSPGKLNLMKEVIVIPKPGRPLHESLDMVLSLQHQVAKQLSGTSKAGNVSSLGCLVLGCDLVDQPLAIIREACEHLALELGTDLYLALNCAAHELMDYSKGRYEVVSGTFKTPDEMVALYLDLINKYPSVCALLDPLRKEDAPQWQKLSDTLASRCHVLADVGSKPVSKFLEDGNLKIPAVGGVVLKHAGETTITDLLDLFRLIEGDGRMAVLACAEQEIVGDSLSDLAVGLGASFIMLGGLLRGERTMKYNRLLAIEDELRRAGTLGTHSAMLSSLSSAPREDECPSRG
ncbi:enolase 4 [Spea bombifrons]|uniref:enolase 4 n=1 Tax=Spea bombifrons TaxID=233779 RepID=UPI00234A1241|nr:enolase 4 [Spea bombifrons]